MGTYVSWKNVYSVGDQSLDAQHKKIISLINDLYGAVDTADESGKLREVLDQLVQYTVTHFQHEERAMQSCGYPDLQNHRALHDQMRRRTVGLRQNLNLVTGRDLLSFLKRWWIDHIQSEDKCYVPYLSAAGAQKSPPAEAIGPIDWLGQSPSPQQPAH